MNIWKAICSIFNSPFSTLDFQLELKKSMLSIARSSSLLKKANCDRIRPSVFMWSSTLISVSEEFQYSPFAFILLAYRKINNLYDPVAKSQYLFLPIGQIARVVHRVLDKLASLREVKALMAGRCLVFLLIAGHGAAVSSSKVWNPSKSVYMNR